MPIRRFRTLPALIIGALALVGLSLPAPTAQAAQAPLVISTTHPADAVVGKSYATTLKATGGNFSRAWKLQSGALPAGLKLNAFGRIAGTPTSAGTSSFTVSVQDSAKPQHTDTAVISLTVQPMHVATTSLPVTHEGKKYNAQLKAVGGTGPYTWSLVAGELPPGTMTLSKSGVISGYQGFFTRDGTFTVEVKDKAGRAAQQELTIHVTWMSVTTPSLPVGTVGKLYSVQLKHLDGCARPTWEIVYSENGPTWPAPLLPPGLKLHASLGLIRGIPTEAWSNNVRVFASCNAGNIFSPYAGKDFTLTIE